jgi:hypothetical protein
VLLTRTQFSQQAKEIPSNVHVVIVFPEEERQAVEGSRGKSFEEEIQNIDTENQDGVMIVVYDDKSGDLQGQCCPMSLEKEFSEEKIRKLIHNDRFLVLKRNVGVNDGQRKAIGDFLQLPELPDSPPIIPPDLQPSDPSRDQPLSTHQTGWLGLSLIYSWIRNQVRTVEYKELFFIAALATSYMVSSLCIADRKLCSLVYYVYL